MSLFAGASCRSILYCRPEQPPPTTATRSTPFGRPCLASSELTFCAALAVNLTRRSSPVRTVAVLAGLLTKLAIMIEPQSNQQDRPSQCSQERRNLVKCRDFVICSVFPSSVIHHARRLGPCIAFRY